MTLHEAQVIFIKNVQLLISKIFADGYECTFGETYRTYLQAWANSLPKDSAILAMTPDLKEIAFPNKVGGSGILKSQHRNRLAIDLNLFKDGAYLSTSKAHKPFGDYWESLHPMNRWGGHWDDGGHYEMNWKQ